MSTERSDIPSCGVGAHFAHRERNSVVRRCDTERTFAPTTRATTATASSSCRAATTAAPTRSVQQGQPGQFGRDRPDRKDFQKLIPFLNLDPYVDLFKPCRSVEPGPDSLLKPSSNDVLAVKRIEKRTCSALCFCPADGDEFRRRAARGRHRSAADPRPRRDAAAERHQHRRVAARDDVRRRQARRRHPRRAYPEPCRLNNAVNCEQRRPCQRHYASQLLTTPSKKSFH